jgi:hypothetical protein
MNLDESYEEFEDTKGVIWIRKSKRTHNRMAKRKRTNNNLQNTTQNYKDIQHKLHYKPRVNADVRVG